MRPLSITLFALAFVGVFAITEKQAMAQPAADCTVGGGGEALSGENVTFSVTIENDGDASGFKPAIQVTAPAGLSLVGGTFDGAAMAQSGGAPATLEFPITAQSTSMPALTALVTFEVDATAPIGTAIDFDLTCAYLFGTDATGDQPAITTDAGATVTPAAVTFETLEVPDVCTGASFPYESTIDIDVASAATLDPFTLTIPLDARFQVTSVTASGTVDLPVGPGGTVTIDYAGLAGGAPGTIEETVIINGFVINGTIDPSTSPIATVPVTIDLSTDAILGFTTGAGAGTQPGFVGEIVAEARPFRISEDIALVSGGIRAPGSVVRYTLSYCLSEDIPMTGAAGVGNAPGVQVTSDIGDGQTFIPGTDTPTAASCDDTPGDCSDSTMSAATTIIFDLGDLAGGTSGTVVYDMVIDEEYSNGDPVLAGDRIATSQALSGNSQSSGSPATVDESSGPSNEAVAVPPPSLTKSADLATVQAGDTATFTLTAKIASGDLDAVVITDYLPQPIYSAGLCSETSQTVVGATNTAVMAVSGNNLVWDFGDVTSSPSAEVTITVVFSCPAQDGPAADGFEFSNVASVSGSSTNGTQTGLDFSNQTISVPEFSISKLANVASAEEGETVTFVASLTNTGSDDAHDVVLVDTLPAGFINPSLTSVSGSTLGAIANSGDLFGAGLSLTPSIPEDEIVTITYTVEVDSVGFADSLANSIAITNFASQSGGANHSNASLVASDTVAIDNFTVAKSLADNVNTTKVVGDDFLYNLSITVPAGTHPSVVFDDRLDVGLVFVEAINFVAPAGVTCGGGACSLPAPTVSTDGSDRQRLQFNMGEIANPSDGDLETFTFQLRAAVANTAEANRGDTPANLMLAGNGSNTSEAITVAEPALAIASSFTGSGDAGDTITLQGSVALGAGGNADAHDILASYNFASTGITPTAGTFVAGVGCPANTPTFGATSFSLAFDTIETAESCSFTISVTIDNGVSNGQTLSVPSSVTWQSILGAPGFGLDERDGSNTVADVDDYIASANVTYTVATAEIAKAFTMTTQASTSDPGIAIGEQAVYTLTVTVPDGVNPNVIVTDNPPPGLAITNVTYDTDDFVGTINPPPAPTSGGQGQTLTFNFGTITATASAGTVGNSFSIIVTTEAEFVDGMASSTPPNVTALSINGAAQASANAPVTFAMPTPVVSLAVSDNAPEGGETVMASATLTNAADAPACDTTVTVVVPSGFSVDDLDSDGLDNDQANGTDLGDESALLSGNTLTFPVVGCIEDGGSITFPFNMTADAGVPPASVSLTGTLGIYESLPDDEGDPVDPANDDANNNGVGGTDEAGDATASLTVTPTAPDLTFTKAVTDVDGAPLEPGETIRYTIVLANDGSGPANGVVITDTIPTVNATFVSGSETIDPAATGVSVAGGVLTSNVGTLANAESVTITFDMVINDPLPTGSAVTNQAQAAVDDGYGPLSSDNPATVASPDATTIATASTNDIDGDGIPNDEDDDPNDPTSCRDSDGDGCDDCINAPPADPNNDGSDVDGDGQCDLGDIDADNDGIPDVNENPLGIDPYGDNDNDGIANFEDATDRGDGDPAGCDDLNPIDGICDVLSTTFDTDGDGIPDHLDLDADNDGIPDVVEAGHGAADDNGDGMVDGPYTADGIAEAVDAGGDGEIDYVIRDTDDDGIPDFQDVDSDNDGETDIEESGNGGLDGDDDGMIDNPVDADNDGVDENVDDDDNVYGGPDVSEQDLLDNYDNDGDGIPDPYDFDDDANGGDSNGDGIDDAIQCPNPPGWPSCPDSDGDGTPDYSEPTDTDGDGVSDANDIDADNDGIPDVEENLLGLDPFADNDDDGIPNYLDADDRGDGMVQVCLDADTDNVCDEVGIDFDLDGDGVPNHIDLDSDNDGIPDVTEAGHGQDTNGDGFVDCPSGFGTNGLCDDVESTPDSGDTNYTVLNTDGDPETTPNADDIPDFLDIDSDGDGENDIDEVAALAGLDGDGDGMIDDPTDLDGDGLMDPVDSDDNTYGFPGTDGNPRPDDADGDGIPDAYDNDDDGPGPGDSDGDGLPDDVECGGSWPCNDFDGDGIPDYMEPSDEDGDLIPDSVDLDDDNDGILDTDENQLGIDPSADNDNDGIPNFIDADDRGDGTAPGCVDDDDDGSCDQPVSDFDYDGDGVPNHFDTDADGDGINDNDESGHGGTDADGDGILDCAGGFGANGLCDEVEDSPDSGTTSEPLDTDDDGDPDFLDLDADGDNISDEDEAGDDDNTTDPVDTDGDGTPDFQDTDSDGDTIPDDVEAGDDDPATPPIDTDGDGDPDYTDTDADGDGIPDEEEAGEDPTNPVDTDGDGDADFQDADKDNDGVNDGEDNCPLVGNEDQTDEDGDGFGIACDSDDNGDGFDDDIGAQGGGCSSTGSSGGAGWLLVAIALGFLFRRRRNGLAIVATVAVFSIAGSAAHAQVAVDSDYTVERFRLSTDRGGILDVESADVPGHLSFDLGLWLGYADDPLNLYRTDESGDRSRIGSLVSHRLGGNLVGSLALWNRLQIGLDVPLVLSQDQQTGNIGGPPMSISSFGLGDLRVAPKLQILRAEDDWLDLAFIVGLTLPTGSSSDYFGDSGAMFQPEIAASKPFTDKLRGAINVGYRARSSQQTLDLEVNDEIYTHLGVGYLVGPKVELDATAAVATASNDIFGRFNRNYSELRGGVAYYHRKMVFFAALGAGTSEGFGAPDWRALAGMRFGRMADDDDEPAPLVTEPTVAEVIPAPEQPLDSDGDGIFDPDDKCPAEAENINSWEDTDGCPDSIPDSDGDGFGDLADKCPNEREDVDGFSDEDGCPDVDNDKDGVVDSTDRCPLKAGPIENVGCPDTDRDSDGVVDRVDNCPDEAGTSANFGCKKKQAVQLVGGKLALIDKVHFRTNRAVIRSVSYQLLRDVANVLNNHPEIASIIVEGHTDDRGSDAYNKDLSQRRAEAVVTYLVKQGVAANRLSAIGYGEEKPIDSNGNRTGRAANRRVEFNLRGQGQGAIENKNSGPTKDTIDN